MSDRPWYISILPMVAIVGQVFLRQLIDLMARRWTTRKAAQRSTQNSGFPK